VLISGSGQQDRDEPPWATSRSLVPVDHLTRNGIAVFRYDDRGWAVWRQSNRNATSKDG
jgi:hypothetical protein